MELKDRKVTFPSIGGKSSLVIKSLLESLGLNVIMPPKMTDDTIKKGVMNCASMICYPLKTTMGSYIEALEKGANTLLAYDTKGVCRFRQYNKLHEFTLTSLGYDFEMFTMNPKNIISTLKKISGKSRLKIIKNLYIHYKKLKKSEEQFWSDKKPNIGIIGEIYVMNNEEVNHHLESKIKSYGCNPFNTATTQDFIKNTISIFNPLKYFKKDEMKEYKKEAEKYLNGPVGGHAVENIYNLLKLADKKVDGIVYIFPMTCTAENCVEPYIIAICKKNKIPLLRLPIDENLAEANFETRLETFCELNLMKKGKK